MGKPPLPAQGPKTGRNSCVSLAFSRGPKRGNKTIQNYTTLQSGGQNQKWPTTGQGGYITFASWGVPTASKQWAKSKVAHKWARWLHNPFHLGGPQCFEAGGKIRGGPQVGDVAT